jgi:hypothetical protein
MSDVIAEMRRKRVYLSCAAFPAGFCTIESSPDRNSPSVTVPPLACCRATPGPAGGSSHTRADW